MIHHPTKIEGARAVQYLLISDCIVFRPSRCDRNDHTTVTASTASRLLSEVKHCRARFQLQPRPFYFPFARLRLQVGLEMMEGGCIIIFSGIIRSHTYLTAVCELVPFDVFNSICPSHAMGLDVDAIIITPPSFFFCRFTVNTAHPRYTSPFIPPTINLAPSISTSTSLSSTIHDKSNKTKDYTTTAHDNDP
eukprot:scaffold1385_cov103-Skeletonema_dohrnii-CCMP3373.AAC.1